jgi:hypothetical protein
LQSFLLIPVLLGSLFLNLQAPPAVDLEKERAELLKQHRLARDAHFKRDATALVSNFAEETIYLRDGRVETHRREESLRRFEKYLASAEFTEWDDLMPPVIRISPDGKMAWMVVRLRGKYTRTGENGEKSAEEFVCSWMSIYEKRNGRWTYVANASTFQP